MNNKMRFTFSYGGDFSGLRYQLNSDSGCLDPVYRELLEAMPQRNAGLLTTSNTVNKNAFSYRLEIKNGDKPVTLVIADNNIPAEYQSLITYLKNRAGYA